MLARYSELDAFDNLFRALGRPTHSKYVPQANITEHQGEYEIQMLVPGYSKSDIKVSAKSGTLTISADVKAGSESAKYREFSLASFERRFSLPRNVDSGRIKAHCENGLLTVTLPSKELEKSGSIDIQVE